MKTVKIALPLSLLPLIGMFIAVHFNGFEMPPEGSGYAGLLVLFAYFFIMVLTIAPLFIFIPFGIALLICELCLFVSQGKFATLTATLVLMCILVPVLALIVAYACVVLSSIMWGATLGLIACAVLYLAAFVAVVVGYAQECHKRRQNRKLQTA